MHRDGVATEKTAPAAAEHVNAPPTLARVPAHL